MEKDKIKTYVLEFILISIPLLALFIPNTVTRTILAVVLLGLTFFVTSVLKKRKLYSIYQKQSTILMTLIALIYVIVFYLMGFYFGYYQATIKLSIKTLMKYIIPIATTIISSEIIRSILIMEKSKISKILLTISMILIDSLFYVNIYTASTYQNFVDTLCFIIFAAISSNLLYNYISIKFGYKPNVVFRLITILYVYIIPITPDVNVLIRCFFRVLVPYLIFLLLEYSYSRNNFKRAYENKKRNLITISILIIIMTGIVMLVSCKFKYGMLVVGSGSMTGTVNMGDAIIFEEYKKQEIKQGDVILFEAQGRKIVHRVIEVRSIDGQDAYFTQGDANQSPDDGYRKNSDIIGITKLKVKYIGYPSLWIRQIFE